MKLSDINKEGDLRDWLSEWIIKCEGRIKLEWVEPAIFGSAIGAPDCKLNNGEMTIGLELKYLLSTKRGIKWAVRPAQRRYHHLHVKHGGKSALLAWIMAKDELVLVRGDHIPLRDYATDVSSGCAHGLCIMEVLNYFSVDPNANAMDILERTLFHNDFWRKV